MKSLLSQWPQSHLSQHVRSSVRPARWENELLIKSLWDMGCGNCVNSKCLVVKFTSTRTVSLHCVSLRHGAVTLGLSQKVPGWLQTLERLQSSQTNLEKWKSAWLYDQRFNRWAENRFLWIMQQKCSDVG